MKNHRKDEISDSGDSPDGESPSPETSERHVNYSKRSSGDSDSESENISSVNKNSKNKSSSEEPTNTTRAETVSQGESAAAQSTFSFEDLSSDDEIYTLQCPSECKKKDLLNKNVNFTKSKTVSTETAKFHFELIKSERKFMTLAIPKKCGSGALVNLPLKGHIIIQKVVNMPASDPFMGNVQKNKKVAFPEDIKVRHPLLGVNWQDHIQIANEAIEKSNHKKSKNTKKEKTPEAKKELKKLKHKSNEDEPSVHRKKRKKSMVDDFNT